MGFQVKFFLILGWGCSFLLLFSCRGNLDGQNHFPVSHDSSENTVQILDEELAQTKDSLVSLALELEWLILRKEIVLAKTRSNQSRESSLKLEREFSNFKALDKRFPSPQGFILEKKKREWEARLQVKKEETKRLEAIVRLLNRDMVELVDKLSHKGFRYQLPGVTSEQSRLQIAE